MSRNLTILALIQFLVVILGFFGLSIVLKAGGYPHDPPFPGGLGRVVWSPDGDFRKATNQVTHEIRGDDDDDEGPHAV